MGSRCLLDLSTHKIFPFHSICLMDFVFEGASVKCEHCNNPSPSFDGGTQFGRMWVLLNWHSSTNIQLIGDCCFGLVPKLGMRYEDQVHGQTKSVSMPDRFSDSPKHLAVMHQFLSGDKKYLGSAFPRGIKSLNDLKQSFTDLGGYCGANIRYKQDGRKFVVYGESFGVVLAKLTESQVVDLLNDVLTNQESIESMSGMQLSLF